MAPTRRPVSITWPTTAEAKQVLARHLAGNGAGTASSTSGQTVNKIRLTLIHIPKTGGTSIESWAAAHHLALDSEHRQKCNSTRRSKWNNTLQATSVRHCLSAVDQSFLDPQELGFCVLRDPLARALSSYNYRNAKRYTTWFTPRPGSTRPRCQQVHFNFWLRDMLAFGEVDNHDVPQSRFAQSCSVRLCYGKQTLQHQFTALLRRWSEVAASRSTWRHHAALHLNTTLPRTLVSGAWCNASDLEAETTKLLLAHYASDVDLYRQTCNGSTDDEGGVVLRAAAAAAQRKRDALRTPPPLPPQCTAEHFGRILRSWDADVATRPRLPRIVHQQWRTSNVSELPEAMRQWRQNCIRLNPGWTFRLYNDEDNRRLVDELAPWFTPTFDAYPLDINRIDAVRFAYLYAFGGLYIDLDYTCVRPFDSHEPLGNASSSAQLLVGEDASEYTGGLVESAGNSWLAAAKGHPLALVALCRLVRTSTATVSVAPGLTVDRVGAVAGVWFVRGLLKSVAALARSAAGAAAIAGGDVANVYPNVSQRIGSAQLSAAVTRQLDAWGITLVPSARVCPFGWRHRKAGVAAWATCMHADSPANHSSCLAMFPQAVSLSFHTFTWRAAGLSRLHCWSGHGGSRLADCLSGGQDGRPPLLGMPRLQQANRANHQRIERTSTSIVPESISEGNNVT